MTPSRVMNSATMSWRMVFSRFVFVRVLVQGMTAITATNQLHSLTHSRTRLREIDSAMPDDANFGLSDTGSGCFPICAVRPRPTASLPLRNHRRRARGLRTGQEDHDERAHERNSSQGEE